MTSCPLASRSPQLKPGSHVDERVQIATDPRAAAPAAGADELPEPPAEPEPETPEDAAERERRYREIFGLAEPRPRRRWRR